MVLIAVVVLAMGIAITGCSESKVTPAEEAKNAVGAEASCQGLSPEASGKCEEAYKSKGQGGEEEKNREASNKEHEAENEEIREGERIKQEKPQEAHEIEEATKAEESTG
jgi:hypothetical protein